MASPYLAFIPQLSCPCTLPLWHFCAVALTCHSWVKSSPALHLCLGPAPCLFGGSASWMLALLYAQVPVSASGASPHTPLGLSIFRFPSLLLAFPPLQPPPSPFPWSLGGLRVLSLEWHSAGSLPPSHLSLVGLIHDLHIAKSCG